MKVTHEELKAAFNECCCQCEVPVDEDAHRYEGEAYCDDCYDDVVQDAEQEL